VVAVFTNEEGARFQPDMLGSLVYAGGLSLADAHATHRHRRRAAWATNCSASATWAPRRCRWHRPHAHVELHIEQGPILDAEGGLIGAVHNVQGISWQALTITGQSNHAGTTPMRLRHDAGYCAAAIGHLRAPPGAMRWAAARWPPGALTLHPNLINVIAARAELTVDLRNTDEALLQQAEAAPGRLHRRAGRRRRRAHRGAAAGALCAGGLRRRRGRAHRAQAQAAGPTRGP
jgi:N-carbamoyl-L-amino-acid hydrolase